jgi:hypothetical protein
VHNESTFELSTVIHSVIIIIAGDGTNHRSEKSNPFLLF